MKEEKTYYEKILVSSGEVPEQDKLKGEYVFIQKDGSVTSLIFPCWMPEGFYEEHFESWLKPVPSPKQEAHLFHEWMLEGRWIKSPRAYKYFSLDDDDKVYCTLSELYDKFKEKGESK